MTEEKQQKVLTGLNIVCLLLLCFFIYSRILCTKLMYQFNTTCQGPSGPFCVAPITTAPGLELGRGGGGGDGTQQIKYDQILNATKPSCLLLFT